MGFYGQFTPLVQGYSCAESPFWLGKAFLCLHLPEDHPFWTAKEHNGTWESLGEKETKVTVLDGPALCFSNHGGNGETVLRTGKVVKAASDAHGMWNYSKLCFNTKYPWEAGPLAGGSVESQQYVLHDLDRDDYETCNATFWHGQRDGVLYRRQFFNYRLDTETHWNQAVNLADIVMPCGILRVDKLRLYKQNVELTLGAYGFPDNGARVTEKTKGNAKAIIIKGKDFTGRDRQLAMTVYDGWEELSLLHSRGTNPDSEKSVVVYAKTARKKHYGNEAHILISQVITKESGEDFSEDEIFPVRSVAYTDPEGQGSYGPVTVLFQDGTQRVVDFSGMEGKLCL